MKSIVLSVFVALAAIPADAQGVRLSSDFLPLAVGNKWTYTIASADGKKLADADMSVTDHRIIGGRSFYILTDYPFVADTSEKIRIIGYDRQEREFVRIVNDKEGPLFLADGAAIEPLEQDGAGLPQKVRLRLDTMAITLQRGVGIIEARIETPAGVRIATMSNTSVGQARPATGVTSAPAAPAPNPYTPKPATLVSTVSAENPRLTLEAVPSASGVKITFTVTNTSDRLLPFRYVSGKAFDLTIRNAAGDEVWHWSRDKYFTQMTRSEALRPQSSWKYEAVWDAKDNDGKAVPPGEYRLVGKVTTEMPMESAPVTFTLPTP